MQAAAGWLWGLCQREMLQAEAGGSEGLLCENWGFGDAALGAQKTVSQRIRGNRSLCFLPLAQLSRREHRAGDVGGWWWWGVKVPMVMTPSCTSGAGQTGGCSQSTGGAPGVPVTSGRGCEASLFTSAQQGLGDTSLPKDVIFLFFRKVK